MEKGFAISDNQGDGNCMFFGLSEQLDLIKGIKISHDELRRTIVQQLREKPKLVSAFFCFIIFRVDIFAVYARNPSLSNLIVNIPTPLSLLHV